MSRYHSYLNSAIAILSGYKGEEPFSLFLKEYFSRHKKYGSKDRKHVSHLCYCYFRLGKALPDIMMEERILISLFLCSHEPHEILQELKPEWNEKTPLPFNEKLKLTGYELSAQDIFLWQNELSEAIDKKEFVLGHLQQPDLFLRIRPGNEEIVKKKLAAAGIGFQYISHHCIALPNSSKIDTIIAIDKEAVIQDHSSQRVGELLQNLQPQTINDKPSLWDCCAASGGKSIMAKDILGEIELTVSDVRESILANLKRRFAEARIKNYKSFAADLTKPIQQLANTKFDLILADVPCSGSGTWSRTPEQLYFFDERKINEYSDLQKRILSTVVHHLAADGYLLYITCSVFKKENEEAVDFITKKFQLELVKMEVVKGYDKRADTMFTALFKNPS